ncbi:MAG: ATP-dependent sacrificial sulfur transferase LarE [Gemmatimonadota bacterium]|jgi:uncharacterized protein
MNENLPILDLSGHDDGEVDEAVAAAKLADLKADLGQRVREGVLVAFSGGMDSAFLLWAAAEASKDAGGRVVALTTTSPSMPTQDKEDADAFSAHLGVEHIWRESRELELSSYSRNDRQRCYHCKAELFRITREVAKEAALRWVLYGYNASDHGDDRPGHRAARESGVLTPLSEAGLGKPEIRFLMREEGLPLSAKPASPCLSSRIMTGIEITPKRLRDVEEMERILRGAGVRTLRVRLCREAGGAYFLRVEAAPEELEVVLKCREELQAEGARRGYKWMTLDLGGYRTGGGVS